MHPRGEIVGGDVPDAPAPPQAAKAAGASPRSTESIGGSERQNVTAYNRYMMGVAISLQM